MKVIKDIHDKEYKVGCLGCDIVNGTFGTIGGSVLTTPYFDVHQDVLIPIRGFMILASKRHLSGVDEFTKEELQDFTDTQ